MQQTKETQRWELTDDGIFTVTLSRPDRLNALNGRMRDELLEAVDYATRETAVKVWILTGEGRAFIAGADLKERGPATDLGRFRENIARTQDLTRRMAALDKPIIAAIGGYALGGGLEIALAADILIAGDDATFGLPEVNVGQLHTNGSTYFLTRMIGLARAKDLALTGEFISAQRAYEIGLVSRLVPRAQLMDTAMQIARTILTRAPLAVRLAKRIFDAGVHGSLEQSLAHEMEAISVIYTSEDRLEGARAFAEKRPPQYKGR